MRDAVLSTRRQPPAEGLRAFTLIEMLVSVAIIALMVSILASALGKVRETSRDFVCKNKAKTVAYEFFMFADEYAKVDRGDSEKLGPKNFYLEDFQERLYGLDEFWKYGTGSGEEIDPEDNPLICPSGPTELKRREGVPCRDQVKKAIWPVKNVSVGFNMRLERASVDFHGRPRLVQVKLSQRIMGEPNVPLSFDVDPKDVEEKQILPFYSAPTAGDTGKYADDFYWFPAQRHGKRLNVSFIGGHVLSSIDPVNESGWKWKFQPKP